MTNSQKRILRNQKRKSETRKRNKKSLRKGILMSKSLFRQPSKSNLPEGTILNPKVSADGLHRTGTIIKDGEEIGYIGHTSKMAEAIMAGEEGFNPCAKDPHFADLRNLWNKIYQGFKYEWENNGRIVHPTTVRDTGVGYEMDAPHVSYFTAKGVTEEDFLSSAYQSIGIAFRYYKYRNMESNPGYYQSKEYINSLVKDKSVILPFSMWNIGFGRKLIGEIEKTLEKYSARDLEKFLD